MHRLFLSAAVVITAILGFPRADAQTAGSCEPGTDLAFLSDSNLQAALYNNGNLFFGGSTTSGDGYFVPKSARTSPLFAAGIWIGGQVNGTPRASAARYGNFLFRPGPLNADGTLPNVSDCSAYDRIYVTSIADIQAYESGIPPARDLAEWPVGLGAPTVDANGDPVDADSVTQVIDLTSGERPDMYGSQMAFWVMNDLGAPRDGFRQTDPIGVEVRVTAFVIASDDQLEGAAEASFYRFTVLNRSGSTVQDARLGVFTDPDLGDAGDDYVGTDIPRGMTYIYNSDNEDSQYGTPPALGFDLLSGLSSSTTFINGGPDGTQDPGTGTEYLNYMRGLWGDGTPITAFGNGYQTVGDLTPYVYPGDPVTETFWSEVNTDQNGNDSPTGDRRAVPAAGLGDLAPGDTATVDLAILFAQGADRFDSIVELRDISDRIQLAYAAGDLFRPGADVEILAAPVLIAPADEADLVRADTLDFSWEAVDGAAGYQVRWDTLADGSFVDLMQVPTETARIGVRDLVSRSGVQSVFWQVEAIASGARGLPSETRSVKIFRPGVLSLSDGELAYVEVTGPGGSDPCADGSRSTSGCEEAVGNPLYRSFNSTGTYYINDARESPGSDASIGAYAPNDYEIRFTESGSLGYYRFQQKTVISVPFEIWDIGSVALGEANDLSDDVQLIPVLFADFGGTCAFNPDEIPTREALNSRFVESDRIYAYYPTTSYADYDATFRPLVEGAPANCYNDSNGTGTIDTFVQGSDFDRPLQRLVFGSSVDAPVLPEAGTVIRIYSADPPFPSVTTELDSPREFELLAAYPNPAARSLTVPYTLAHPSAVELAIYDVLGRRVVERVTTRQLEGTHETTVDARALAPGVYIIRLRAGEEERTTRVTVAR